MSASCLSPDDSSIFPTIPDPPFASSSFGSISLLAASMAPLRSVRSPSALSIDVVKNSRPPMSAHPASSTPFFPPSFTTAFHFFASTPAGGPSSFFGAAACAGGAVGAAGAAGTAGAGAGLGSEGCFGAATGLGLASRMYCWSAARALGGMAAASFCSASASTPSALCFVRYALAASASALLGLFLLLAPDRPELLMAAHRPPLKSSGLSAATTLIAALTTFLTSLILK
mmetsp:Transcript_9399/g.18825  ORF Transcript_9399/g.18825 Transcript_9399/m.18825 type:complete len:229 (-) Transcript_9399:169-855(-)